MFKLASTLLRAAATTSAVTVSILAFGASAQAVNPEVVTINSSGTVFTPAARLDSAPVAAVANVILLAGGNGLLNLDANGYPQSSSGNFLIRSGNEFMLRGMNVMMADVAPALPTGISYTARLNGTHKAMIQTFINAAATRWPGKPIWVIGTSNGSVSTVAAAGDTTPVTGAFGFVLTSSVTVLDTPANQALFDADKLRINKPTYVVWNAPDSCSVSPPAGSLALFNALTTATKSSLVMTGGHSVMSDLCGAFSWHGYAGLEAATVAPIVAYIRQVSGVSAPAPAPMPMPAPVAKPLAVAPSLGFASSWAPR